MRQQRRNNFFVFTILCVLLSSFGCSTLQKKNFSELNSGAFEAKVLVRDKSESKSGIVNVQFKAVKEQKIRMDVLSPVQTHLASLTLNGEELKYILPQEKKAFRGVAAPQAMTAVLKMPLNPKLLYNIFFDLPISEKGWSCTKDKSDLLLECKTVKGDLKIKWVTRSAQQRVLEVEHAKAFLQINIHKFKGEVKANDSKFDLKIPDNFKLI